MTGVERDQLQYLKNIDKSLQSIAKSLALMVKPKSNVLTEEQLRSEGYDNI